MPTQNPYIYISQTHRGRRLVFDGDDEYATPYIIQCMPENQMFYCEQFGFCFALEEVDEDASRLVFKHSLQPVGDQSVVLPMWWNRDTADPWYIETYDEVLKATYFGMKHEGALRKAYGEQEQYGNYSPQQAHVDQNQHKNQQPSESGNQQDGQQQSRFRSQSRNDDQQMNEARGEDDQQHYQFTGNFDSKQQFQFGDHQNGQHQFQFDANQNNQQQFEFSFGQGGREPKFASKQSEPRWCIAQSEQQVGGAFHDQ